ncbi:hypothetical protein AB0K00_56270 [Dactylosporangium sp. NPDC049525]|uniref:hypothetical protein n=1 Tax=Dactylosporangium sp. NPDC049525 TaxID=3154730 RepID=UPI0034273677
MTHDGHGATVGAQPASAHATLGQTNPHHRKSGLHEPAMYNRGMDAKRAQGIGFSAAMGAAAGAALAAHRGPRGAIKGALLGAGVMAVVDATARAVQKPNEVPAVWSRIAASGAIAAPIGWAAGKRGASPLAVGVASGAIAGAMGIRPHKVALGPVVGLAVGAAMRGRPPAQVAAASVVAFRTLSQLVFRDPQVTLVADKAPAERLPFVVPLGGRIGRQC